MIRWAFLQHTLAHLQWASRVLSSARTTHFGAQTRYWIQKESIRIICESFDVVCRGCNFGQADIDVSGKILMDLRKRFKDESDRTLELCTSLSQVLEGVSPRM